MDISHLKQKFIDEANDLLSGLDNDLLALEKNPDSKQHIDQVFRTMHTIKGASGMYGLDKITEVTHDLETLYGLVRDQKLSVTQQLIDITLYVADHIHNLLTDHELIDAENASNHCKVKERLDNFQKKTGLAKPQIVQKPVPTNRTGIATWQILFYPEESLIFRGVNLSIIIADLYSLGKCEIQSNIEDKIIAFWNIYLVTDKGKDAIEDVLLFIEDNCRIIKIADFDIFDKEALSARIKENEDIEITRNELASEGNRAEKNELEGDEHKPEIAAIKRSIHQVSNRIHVDAAKLDTLMYLVTELVTAKSELLLAIEKQSNIKIIETAEKIEKLSKQFSDNALNIRLVPLQEMLLKYQRLIRDLSKLLCKKVNFVLTGEGTELDKNIVDTLAEPIMHLIRNCIDHGIEMPEKRLENGKEEIGIIFFNAYKSGNNVFIQVGDDGTGIDTDYVCRKAVDQGFIPAGAQLSEKEIFDLIFLPGFSTAQSLTEVSGRGVGMDIVLKKIQEIRGEIFVESTRGKGTTFTIKLQQTISIIDTLLVRSHKSVYAIPIEDVESCDLEEHVNIFDRQSGLINYNKEIIPVLYLRKEIMNMTEFPEKEKIIVISKQGKKYAIVADEIIGQHQAVIKPLGNTLKGVNFISGASILGDGSIALLLDTEKLKELLVVQQTLVN